MKNMLKRTLAVLVAVIIMLGTAPLSGFVGLELPDWLSFDNLFAVEAKAKNYSGSCGDNLMWSLNTDSGALIITGTGAMTDYKTSSDIPWTNYDSTIKSISLPDGLTYIDDFSFSGCSITSITIPDSVKNIGGRAFSGCLDLTSATIGGNVTSIGEYAFDYCTNLVSVTIGSGAIGNGAFSRCYSLTNLTIADRVTSIGRAAFSDCTGLSSIIIPDSITSIGTYAFNRCSNLTNITIPNSITSIAPRMFYECTGLTNVTIPESITSIGESAFFGCISLATITIPDSVTSIGHYAFFGCTSLTGITIPNGVTIIEYFTFGDCTSLARITMPNSITVIEACAFDKCVSLMNITIPDSVTSIGESAFYLCENLTDIYYSGSEAQWNRISIERYNTNLNNVKIHFNSSGNNNETQEYKHMTLGVHNNSFEHSHSNFDNLGFDDDMFNYLCDIERSNGHADNINFLQEQKEKMTKDWNGSCYGFAATMALIYKNNLSLDNLGFDETHFYQLKSPQTPGYEQIGKVINYYQLATESKSYLKNRLGDSADYLSLIDKISPVVDDRSKIVLSRIVSLAQNAEKDGDAFIFGFEVSKYSQFVDAFKNSAHIGHAIVCVGYNGLVEENGKKYHSIRLIDSNYTSGYTTVFIDEDFKDWHFKNGEYTEYEHWCSVSYVLLESFDIVDLDGENNEINWSTRTSSLMTQSVSNNLQNYSNESNLAIIRLMKYLPVNIVNEKGETLSFDGLNFSGTMQIYDTYFINTGNYNYCCVETDISELYTFTADESLFFSLSVNGNYYSADLLGGNEAVISVGNNMNLSGDEMEGTCHVDVNSEETDMISCSITKSDEINITQSGSNVVINTDDNSSQIKYFKDADVRYLTMESDTGVYKINNYSEDYFYHSKSMNIMTPSTTKISYGDSIVLHFNINEELPSGWKIVWETDNNNFSKSVSFNGKTCTITPSKSGDTTFTVKVLDAEGKEVSSDTQKMTSKSGFFDKFIAFFKKLFGLTKVIPQEFKG